MIAGFGVGLTGVAAKNPAPAPSACEPFREAIELGLSRGRNALAIWQDLVAEHGFPAGYLSVQRFIRKLRGSQPVQARAVICTAPRDIGGVGARLANFRIASYSATESFLPN